MAIKVIVFDFDGTLVDSKRLKYDAYFKLFECSEDDIQTIRTVLSEMYEESRFVILAEILKRLGTNKEADLNRKVNDIAARYNDIVLTGAKSCAEIPGAETMLRFLRDRYKLYVSSTTPDAALKEIVYFRRWSSYFVETFGHPHQKSRTLQHIKERENVAGSEVLVIGDGESDRKSAEENGCRFFHVDETFNFDHFDMYIESIQND